MKKTKQILAILLALTLCLAVAGCGKGAAQSTAAPAETADEAAAETVLRIAEQGMFSAGGTVTEPVAGDYDPTQNWLDITRAGNTAHVDHANVFYQIPAEETGAPIVYLHGYGQSRITGVRCWP